MKERVDIKPYTTFGVGGTVKQLTEVGSAKEAVALVVGAKEAGLRHVILSGGSNVIFADGLLDIFVIKITSPRLYGRDGELIYGAKDLIKVEGNEIVCDAGVWLGDVIKLATLRGLAGLEALSGIPGSVGGAVVGNAGAYGQAISGPLKAVEVFDGETTRWIPKDECQFSYKESVFKHRPWLVVSTRFLLASGDKGELIKKSEEIIEVRNKKFPATTKCAGSFFKNILVEKIPKTSLKFVPKDRDYYGKIPAWYFLDAVGAKGMTEGGAKVADFHGNILMNTGTATCKEVLKLAERLKKLVKDKFGITLEEEVRYIK